MFTTSSILKVDYSAKYTNIEVDYKRFNLKTTAVIAAVSFEDGLTFFKCYEKSINREKYNEFIKELRKKIGNRRSTLFVDNLSVHRCLECLNTCREQGFEVIFNTPYSPQFMPIELVFS
jgi:transposase